MKKTIIASVTIDIADNNDLSSWGQQLLEETNKRARLRREADAINQATIMVIDAYMEEVAEQLRKATNGLPFEWRREGKAINLYSEQSGYMGRIEARPEFEWSHEYESQLVDFSGKRLAIGMNPSKPMFVGDILEHFKGEMRYELFKHQMRNK